MRTVISRRLLASSGLAATLWLLSTGVRWALSHIDTPAAGLTALVPEVVPRALTWDDSGAWAPLTALVGALAIALVYASLSAALGRSGAPFVTAWFATAAAGALVGLALDLAASWSWLVDYGPRGLLSLGFGTAAASGALWGLAVGWVPALLAGQRGTRPDEPTRTARRPEWLLPVAAIAVVAAVASGATGDNAHRAALAAQAAVPPEVPGVPVPETADVSLDLSPDWCTPDKAMVLKGEPDAATGHRGMPIRLMNFSDEPCVVEGYPDIAFGDQNEHLLEVTIEHGGSFMAQDPGVQRIEVPAGGYAITVLGWDAASTHGALVTETVYAAATPGLARGSWPIDLDIVGGSTVAVTAWALDTGAAPGS